MYACLLCTYKTEIELIVQKEFLELLYESKARNTHINKILGFIANKCEKNKPRYRTLKIFYHLVTLQLEKTHFTANMEKMSFIIILPL